MSLPQEWLEAKEAERVAVERRREIEDKMTASLGVRDSLDGTSNFDLDGYAVKVVGRLNHKIDSEKLDDLALESGLEDYLSLLFRYKPELNVSAWKKAAPEITGAFAPAITTTPGRPSYSVEKKSEED